jgi:predicted nucleic acid-binding protein
MTPRKVVLDTNLYIDWMNEGLHEDLFLGADSLRFLSAVVTMELRAGAATLVARRAVDRLVRAYKASRRLLVPTAEQFDAAGEVLERLRRTGVEVRRASLVDDVLVALSARGIGATVVTRDRDFVAIESIVDVRVERIL